MEKIELEYLINNIESVKDDGIIDIDKIIPLRYLKRIIQIRKSLAECKEENAKVKLNKTFTIAINNMLVKQLKEEEIKILLEIDFNEVLKNIRILSTLNNNILNVVRELNKL